MIEPAHHQDEHRGECHVGFIPTKSSGHDGQEGDKNVSRDQDQRGGFPATRLTMQVSDGFLRNIGIPDQQILTESDVSPEEDEAERKFAQVVIVFRRDVFR